MKTYACVGMMLILLVATAAHGQAYRWVDKDGKVRYGDVPPSGTKAKALKPPPPAPAAPPAAKSAAKAAPAQKNGRETAEKAEREKQELAAARENCARSKENLGMLESGQRIARTDAKGERYYMDDAQRAQETAKAREALSQWCK